MFITPTPTDKPLCFLPSQPNNLLVIKGYKYTTVGPQLMLSEVLNCIGLSLYIMWPFNMSDHEHKLVYKTCKYLLKDGCVSAFSYFY